MAGTIAVIGAGNMGGAMAEAVCRVIPPEQVYVYNPTRAKSEALSAKTGCMVAESAEDAVRACRYVLLGVKPQILDGVLRNLFPCLRDCLTRGEEKILLSIAAGVSLAQISEVLRSGDLELPVVRMMPNTPVAVGEGLMLFCPSESVSSETVQELTALFAGCGLVEQATEREIDLGMSVFSCSPAFAYLFLEGMADGGVQIGLPRDKAQRYAAQAVLGAAAMVLRTGKHPGQLKDEVCSPGGYTIRGVHTLEQAGFRAAAADAVIVASGID
jgi:pyrroline-5-carboxylate reductase